jgi:hypothetical protein
VNVPARQLAGASQRSDGELTAIENLRAVLGHDAAAIFPAEWIREALQCWLRPGADLRLSACLGLPAKAKSVRCKLRDAYLVDASNLLVESGTWKRPEALLRATRRFENMRLRRWRSTGIPPGAAEIEIALFRAYETGAPMPTSTQGFWKILGGASKKTKPKVSEKFVESIAA